MKQYKIGDRVWYAHYGSTRVDKPCPVCYGAKRATLVLGNGDKVELECDYCSTGFPRYSTGTVRDYELIAKPEPLIITSIESKQDRIGQTLRYYSGGRYYPAEDLFPTKKEALARCQEKMAKDTIDQETRAENLKQVQYKSYTWNAGYHIRRAEEHAKKAEYHRQKAILCEARAK